jgi:Zn ribbon nucleic-acid-binding protein
MTEHEMRLKIQDYDCTYGDNPFLIHCPLNKPCMKHKYEKLHQKLLEETQTKGVECDKCGWAMKFPDEPCRCELEEKVKLLRSALDILFDEATNSSNIYTHDGWNVRNPYLELPKKVEEQVREALRVTEDIQ